MFGFCSNKMSKKENTVSLPQLSSKFVSHQSRYTRGSLLNKRMGVSLNTQDKTDRQGRLEKRNDVFSKKEIQGTPTNKHIEYSTTTDSVPAQRSNGKVEVMDAQKILDLNKDIFYKHLQDPSSIFHKHFVDLHNASSGQVLKEIHLEKKKLHHFLRNNDKEIDTSSKSPKRIVLLKPNQSTTISPFSSPTSSVNSMKDQKGTSHFSIKDLKRRLKNLIGESTKKRDLSAVDGFCHKFPYGSNNSKSNNIKTSSFTRFFKNENTENVEPNIHTATTSLQRNFVNFNAQNEVISSRQVSESYDRSLSFEESYKSSPRFSPKRDKVVIVQMSTQEDSNCSDSPAESISCSLSDYSSDKAKSFNEEDFTNAGSLEVEDCDYPHPNILVEFGSDKYISTSNRCNEENLDANSYENAVSLLEPSILNRSSNSHERVDQLLNEPWKLSLKEFDDQILRNNFDETKYSYIRTVLEVSGVNGKQLENFQSSDHILDQHVFEEVEILYDHLLDDSKLLFACIDEVLMEIKHRYSTSSPWVSIIKSNVRPLPVGEDFVNEVCKGVEKRFEMVFPYTIDMLIQRDLESGPWIDDSRGIEGAVSDVGDVILDYLMEETILELWE